MIMIMLLMLMAIAVRRDQNSTRLSLLSLLSMLSVQAEPSPSLTSSQNKGYTSPGGQLVPASLDEGSVIQQVKVPDGCDQVCPMLMMSTLTC